MVRGKTNNTAIWSLRIPSTRNVCNDQSCMFSVQRDRSGYLSTKMRKRWSSSNDHRNDTKWWKAVVLVNVHALWRMHVRGWEYGIL